MMMQGMKSMGNDTAAHFIYDLIKQFYKGLMVLVSNVLVFSLLNMVPLESKREEETWQYRVVNMSLPGVGLGFSVRSTPVRL